MATWTWVLADEAGRALAELTTAQDRKLTYTRNTFSEAAFALGLEDEAASLLVAVLENGTPQLRAYRDHTLRFSGLLTSAVEDAEEEGVIRPVFRDPFAVLIGDGSTRGRLTPATLTYSQEDQGDIAADLVMVQAGGADGLITLGTVEASLRRDRTYEHKNIGQALVELSQVQGGFDFAMLPLDGSGGGPVGQFEVYRREGQDRPEARFEYGEGTLANVSKVTRQTQPPINDVRVIGQNGLVGVAADDESIARHGRYTALISASDVSEQATLDAKAAEALSPSWIRVVSFEPDPELAPQPWDDYWLGDTVRHNVRRGSLSYALRPRINAVALDLDSEGNETRYTLTIDEGVTD